MPTKRVAKPALKRTAPPSAQPAAERRAAEARLAELVEAFAPAHAALVAAMRRWLRKRMPTAHEVVYEYDGFFVISYSPNGNGYDGVLGVRASADRVALYFNNGKELPDPDRLLRGSAKQVRSIDVDAAAVLARPAVVRLVDAALAHHRVPFDANGRGAVVVRATTAASRARRRPA